MNISPKEIIKINSYTEDEQETFEYLRKYMILITPKFKEIEKDKEKLKRFALIGLFLTYRAFNHMGKDLTTETDYNNNTIIEQRLKLIKEVFNIKINNSLHYLNLINFTIFDFMLANLKLKNISKKFYKFVMLGK